MMRPGEILQKLKKAALAAVGVVADTFDLRDAHVYGGLLMLGYGVSLVSSAAAWTITGLLMFWIGVRK